MSFTQPLTIKLADADAEAVRRNVDQRIREFQGLPAAGLIVVGDFTIANNGSVLVNHRLGRRPAMVWISPPRVEFGAAVNPAGVIYDVTGNGVDRTQSVSLAALGYGVPVIVTVAVL